MSPPREALPPGTVLDGRYELAHRIGDGADAEAYAALDRVLERTVTVRVHRGSSEDRARFEREVQQMAGRDGPARERVFDAGTDGDLAYVVLEPRDGEETTEAIAVVAAPVAAGEDLTQPIATDHTAELPVPLLLPDPEPEPLAPAPPRWSGRATRNVAIAAACLVGVGALVLAAGGGPTAVETPTAPSSTVADDPAVAGTSAGATLTTPTTAPTTTVQVTETTTAMTLFPPGFPFEDGGPKGKERKG